MMRCDTNADVNTGSFHFYFAIWIVLIKSKVFDFFFLTILDHTGNISLQQCAGTLDC